MIPEISSHAPVPVGTEAITPAIPYPQAKPGKCCEKEGYQVPFSKPGKYPTKRIKKNQERVKEKEEIVEYRIHVNCSPLMFQNNLHLSQMFFHECSRYNGR